MSKEPVAFPANCAASQDFSIQTELLIWTSIQALMLSNDMAPWERTFQWQSSLNLGTYSVEQFLCVRSVRLEL